MSTVTIDTHILYALLSKASNLGQAGKDLGLDVCTIWSRIDVPLNFVTQLKRCADDLSKIARENDESGYLEIQRATFPYHHLRLSGLFCCTTWRRLKKPQRSFPEEIPIIERRVNSFYRH